MTNHATALSFARDTTVYAHAPAAEDVANLKAAYLELREVQTYVELLARLDVWGPEFAFARDAATAIRNLQAAYTAAHSELERAVADLAACREVADGLRENATLPYIVEYTMRGYDEWKPMAAFDVKTAADQYATGCRSETWDYRVVDAAIKEQSHE